MGKFGLVRIYRGRFTGQVAYYYRDVLVNRSRRPPTRMDAAIAFMKPAGQPGRWRHVVERYSNLTWLRPLTEEEIASLAKAMLLGEWRPI